jgi:hypothetical protein
MPLTKKHIEEYKAIYDDATRLIQNQNWRAAEARCNDGADYWQQVIAPKLPAEERHQISCMKLRMTLASCFGNYEKVTGEMNGLVTELEKLAA